VNRDAVESGAVKNAGYDPVEQVLEVEFHDGGVYKYFGVTHKAYNCFLSARSKSGFIRTEMKGLSYEKVEEDIPVEQLAEGDLMQTSDAVVWAAQFMLRWGSKLNMIDAELMTTWFSSYGMACLDNDKK
jgi:hypothetical protein